MTYRELLYAQKKGIWVQCSLCEENKPSEDTILDDDDEPICLSCLINKDMVCEEDENEPS